MKATVELEIELEGDTLSDISKALHVAAENIRGCHTVRRGLGIYLLDKDCNDVGCVAMFGGARDYPLEKDHE